MDAEQIFRAYFFPLYPKDAREDLARARATNANPAKNAALYAHLDEAADRFAQMADAAFGAPLALDFTDASVHRLSAALSITLRDAWAAEGKGTPESLLFNVVVHGAAYVGACVVKNHGAAWSVRRPLWESVVTLSSRAGTGDLAVFQWWLKSLAEDALARSAMTLADRYRAYVEVPCMRPEELAVIAPADRALPRITKVRYDVFYKYLKAHLPELRDVGEHFPSPERFEELGLRWLDFKLLAEGRMLLLSGLGSAGLHLFWLTLEGFQKAAFYPCDSFPEPVLKVAGDKLTVIISVDEKATRHEMLYWGV